MKKLIVVFLVCGLVWIVVFGGQKDALKGGNIFMRVRFSVPQDITSVFESISRSGLTLLSSSVKVSFRGEEWFGLVFPEQDERSADGFFRSKELISLLVSSTDQCPYYYTPSDEVQNEEELRVLGLVVAGSEDLLVEYFMERMEWVSFAGRVELTPSMSDVHEVALSSIQESINIAPWRWAPDFGKTIAWTYENDRKYRYVKQLMVWSDPRFLDTDAYIHDYSLNSDDGRTFFTDEMSEYNYCYPKIVFAIANWPPEANPFVDWRLREDTCSPETVAFSMGVTKASALEGGRCYYSFIKTYAGDAFIDEASLTAVRGVRNTSSCEEAPCITRVQEYPLFNEPQKLPGEKTWLFR